MFYPLDWATVNQRRPAVHMDHAIIVDSKSLFDPIKTLYENVEYILGRAVQRIRYSFESKDISVIRCVQTFANFSDALTKRNLLIPAF